MKLFISWSGASSNRVATVLRDWLPDAYHNAEPFMSSSDIHAGSRWQAEVASELEKTDFGIICVTAANQDSRWLNFEAGALSKVLDRSRLAPLAIDLKVSDISNPLAQFQAQPMTAVGVTKILTAVDSTAERPLGAPAVKRSVQRCWPDFQNELKDLPSEPEERQGSTRDDRDLLEEVVNIVRTLSRVKDDPPRPVHGGHAELAESVVAFYEIVSDPRLAYSYYRASPPDRDRMLQMVARWRAADVMPTRDRAENADTERGGTGGAGRPDDVLWRPGGTEVQ